MWMYYQILLTKIPENVQQLEGETTSQILLVTGLMKGKKKGSYTNVQDNN